MFSQWTLSCQFCSVTVVFAVGVVTVVTIAAAAVVVAVKQHCGKHADLDDTKQMKCGLTCEQVAMTLRGRPIDGAQATSRTQSLCPSSFWSSTHCPSSSLLGRERDAIHCTTHFPASLLVTWGIHYTV